MFLAFDAVEAEFVNHQEIVGGQLPDLLRQRLVGQRGGQFRQQRGATEVTNAEAMHTSTTAQRFEQEALADARLSDQNEVAFAADEVAGGQFLDLGSLDRALEVPVEVLQQTDLAEVRLVDPTFDGAFAPLVGQAAEQAVGELQVRPAFLLGLAEQRIKRLADRGDLQRVQVVQQQAAQVRRRRRRTTRRRCRRLGWAASFRHGAHPR